MKSIQATGGLVYGGRITFSCLQGDGPMTGGIISVGRGTYKQ